MTPGLELVLAEQTAAGDTLQLNTGGKALIVGSDGAGRETPCFKV